MENIEELGIFSSRQELPALQENSAAKLTAETGEKIALSWKSTVTLGVVFRWWGQWWSTGIHHRTEKSSTFTVESVSCDFYCCIGKTGFVMDNATKKYQLRVQQWFKKKKTKPTNLLLGINRIFFFFFVSKSMVCLCFTHCVVLVPSKMKS